MSDSGRKNPPAGAMVPGPDGCAYLVSHGPQAAFRLTDGPAGSPASETFAGSGGKSASKRIRESLAHLPQMPVGLC